MKKYIFGFDLPMQVVTSIYGEFEEPKGMSKADILEMCRDLSVLEKFSNMTRTDVENYKHKGLRLLFLVFVDDEARMIESVFPLIPDERLECEVYAIRMKISNENESMKGVTENA